MNFQFLAFLAGDAQPRMFALDQQTILQIIANIFNVVLLAVIMTWLLYKPVRKFLADRAERIKGQLDHAAAETEKADALKLQYEQKIAGAEREREAILDEARKQAADTARQMLADAKKEADTVRARAQANVEMEWERAQEHIRMSIIDVSAAMSEKFITLAISKETHDKLFKETMAELEGMAWRS